MDRIGGVRYDEQVEGDGVGKGERERKRGTEGRKGEKERRMARKWKQRMQGYEGTEHRVKLSMTRWKCFIYFSEIPLHVMESEKYLQSDEIIKM